MKTSSNYCVLVSFSLGSRSVQLGRQGGLLTVNLINVYSVESFMKNTLAILSYLIFNNILEDFFLNQRILKNKVTITKPSDFPRDK